MNLTEFKEKFEQIKKMGWIETKKIKNTNGGAGNTLETLLGVKENNLKSPDLGEIELKTTKKSDNQTITLFTHDKDIWKINQKDVLIKYGKYVKEKNRHDMYYIHETKKPTSNGFTTKIGKDSLEIFTPDNEKVIDYPFKIMAENWNSKVKQTIFVKFIERKNEKNIREYKFEEMKYRVGKMTTEIMKSAWEKELLILETSLHYSESKKSVRNHGTKIRAKQNNLDIIYSMGTKKSK